MPTQTITTHRQQVDNLISRGALFVINHSGGKDSQAMDAVLRKIVPAAQIVRVHCDLGDVEWMGVKEHISANINGADLHLAHAIYKDGSPKTFLNMVANRHQKNLEKGKNVSPWPSSGCRECTSDLKTGPGNKVIRRLSNETGRKIIVSCFGFRAEESDRRAAKVQLGLDAKNCTAGREWYEFSPIHDLTTEQVFQVIAQAGQKPHWAYQRNDRLSCVFCVFGSLGDLRHGAEQRPELYRQYVELEHATGKTIRHGKTLEQVTGIYLNPLAPANHLAWAKIAA